jgi:hypothetical protein
MAAAVSAVSIFRFASGEEVCGPVGAVVGKFVLVTGGGPIGGLGGVNCPVGEMKPTGFARSGRGACIAVGWGLLTGAFWRPIE